jgi:hypothetical protein
MRRLRSLSDRVNFTFRRRMAQTALILCTLAVLLLALLSSGKNPFRRLENTAAARETAAAKQKGCCADQPAVLRRMTGTYYTTEGNFRSTLILNNKGPHQIAVTPILHGKNGQTFNAPQVFVNGEASVEVDLNAIAASAGEAFRSGSFEFTYQGRMMEMGGGLRIVGADRSLIFDEQLLEPGMKFSSPQMEAVYAIPADDAHVSVIVTNTTAQPLKLSGEAIFNVNGQRPIEGVLKPYETEVIELPKGWVNKASIGAVSLKHGGDKGALMAIIHVRDDARGYSEAVNFTDPAQGKTTQLHGAGLRLGRVNNEPLTPVIAVRNISKTATVVAARVPYAKQNGDTGVIALPKIELGPGELKLLNAANAQFKQSDFATAGLEIEHNGAPGSVIATAKSISTDGNHVFAVPLKDPQGGMSSTGGYPWFITPTASTVVFIKNTTQEPQKFHVTVTYAGGKWGSDLKTLAPGQTYALDVKKVRDAQEKGADNGNPIPADATSGHIGWTLRGAKDKVLIGRAQTVDFTNALASTYECQCVCGGGYVNSYIMPNNAIGFVGNTTQFTVYEIDSNCYGGYTAPYVAGGYFSSANPSIATVNSTGYGTCVSVGTTTINNELSVGTWQWAPFGGGTCEWNPFTVNNYANCQVNDFTITTSNGTIWPSGTGAAGTTTTTTITIQTAPATQGQSVEVFLGEIVGSGGHVGHSGTRPLGTLAAANGITDANGRFQTTYTSSVFAGAVAIQARMASTSTIRALTQEISVPGLTTLGASNDYILWHNDNFHPSYHYGAASALTNLPLIANDYNSQFYPSGIVPNADKLNFNDMSLISGGKFEAAAGDWSQANIDHGEHRLGLNCDMRSFNVPQNRWQALTGIFDVRGSPNYFDETGSTAPHWHLRF